MRIISTAATIGAVLLAAGCSSSHPAGAPSSSGPAVSAPASPVAVELSASPSASPSPSAQLLGKALGTAQSASAIGVTIKATASQYRVVTLTGSNQETLPAGTKVALVQAEGCVTANSSGSGIALTWQPWTLVTSTGATVAPLDVYGSADWPGSLYPNDSTVATPVGRCRSGLVPFSLAGVSGSPVAVEYNVRGIVLDWRVS